MPGSSTKGKEWIKKMWASIRSKPPIDAMTFHITDVGAGQGTYSDLLRDPANEIWTALEIFYPYVGKYGLDKKYDRIIIADVRYYDWYSIPAVQDVIIFGDVLEHMMKHEALSVLNKARERGRYIIGSVPIGKNPQGTVDGNPYEKHVDSWSFDELRRLARYSNLDGEIGTFVL